MKVVMKSHQEIPKRSLKCRAHLYHQAPKAKLVIKHCVLKTTAKRINVLMEKPLVQIWKVYWCYWWISNVGQIDAEPLMFENNPKVAEHEVIDEDLEIEHDSKA